mgnify:CR=1 FL=1
MSRLDSDPRVAAGVEALRALWQQEQPHSMVNVGMVMRSVFVVVHAIDKLEGRGHIDPCRLTAVLAVLPHHREAARGKNKSHEGDRTAALAAAIAEADLIIQKLGVKKDG